MNGALQLSNCRASFFYWVLVRMNFLQTLADREMNGS